MSAPTLLQTENELDAASENDPPSSLGDQSVNIKECAVRREEGGRLWNEHQGCRDGMHVTNSLSDGLTLLRVLLFKRIHEDVESKVGADSMLFPVSPVKSELAAKVEIELFAIAESACLVGERGYVSHRQWYLEWLTTLRLGQQAGDSSIRRRIERYLLKDADQRRLSFSAHLEKAYPEARRAPLVLFRLFPLSVGVATALALGFPQDAKELRKQQMRWLPAIQDCHECHGALLENGEKCRMCSNPLWTYRWLTVAD